MHSLTVTAPGYDTFNKKLFVNSEEATIVVGMSGDGTGTDSTTEETETENNAETANEADSSAEGAAGSLQEVLQEVIRPAKAVEQHREAVPEQ